MLKVSAISKSFGDVTVLKNVTFTINAGERAGLIGPNGAGKSTLLKIIAGDEKADSGSAALGIGERLGYLAQALVFAPAATVGDVVGESVGAALSLSDDIEHLAAVIASETDPDAQQRYMAEYAEALDQMERMDGYGIEARLKEVLAGLGLDTIETDTPVAQLSGGQKTRLGLARLLLSQPDVLLLDEPTNHLDITALAWLERFIVGYTGAVLVVSHDRAFLDRVVTQILELSEERHTVRAFPGTYDDYLDAIITEQEKQTAQYRREQDYIARMEADISGRKSAAKATESSTINFAILALAKKKARVAKVRERKLDKYKASDARAEKPQQTWHMKLDFGATPPSGQSVLRLENVAKTFGDRRLLTGVNAELRHGERVALVGPNGAGKTTLLRLIDGSLAPDAGGRVFIGAGVQVGYFSQEQEGLDPQATPLEIARTAAPLDETEARSFLHFFLFGGDDVFVPVARLSYGERARLAVARIALTGVNLLLLDEPINHLDIPSRARFEQALTAFEGTTLAVAHDRYFIEGFATRIWAVLPAPATPLWPDLAADPANRVANTLMTFGELDDYDGWLARHSLA